VVAKCGREISDVELASTDVPKVFADYVRDAIEFGSLRDCRRRFSSTADLAEVAVDIERGKTLIVRFCTPDPRLRTFEPYSSNSTGNRVR
jgi:pyruvate carboxylase